MSTNIGGYKATWLHIINTARFGNSENLRTLLDLLRSVHQMTLLLLMLLKEVWSFKHQTTCNTIYHVVALVTHRVGLFTTLAVYNCHVFNRVSNAFEHIQTIRLLKKKNEI